MRIRHQVQVAVASCVLAATGTHTFGDFQTFSDKNAFLAAIAANPTIVDFEGADTDQGNPPSRPDPNYTAYPASANTSFGPGNVLTQTAGTLYAVTTGFGAENSDGDTNVVFDGNSGGTMAINGSFSAFGLDVMTANSSTTVNFQLSYTNGTGSPLGVTVTDTPKAQNGPKFFGVVALNGEQFTSMVSVGPNTPYFDNVILGTAVPEPASFILLGLGSLFLARRLRH